MERFLRSRIAGEALHEDAPMLPSMTISRQCGAGLDRIGTKLAEFLESNDDSSDLEWGLFNQSLVGKIIEDQKLKPSLQPFLTECTKFPIGGDLGKLLNSPPSSWTLFNHSSNVIRRLCRMGNAIVIGRAANFVTADMANTFHVRLTGTENTRINYTAERYGLSTKEAQILVTESDRSRALYVKRYTGADIDDPNCYHLLLNTDELTDEVLVCVLGEAVLEWASSPLVDPTKTAAS